MTGAIWIIFALLAALGMWVAAGIVDAAGSRRPPPRVVQPRREVVPLLPPPRTGGGPWHPEFVLNRGRRVRAARARARSVLLGRTRPAIEDAAATPRRHGA